MNPLLAHLTERELEVIRGIAVGKTSRKIADELFVSIKTVEKHRQSAMDKTGRHSVALLTHLAIRANLVDLV